MFIYFEREYTHASGGGAEGEGEGERERERENPKWPLHYQRNLRNHEIVT